MASTYLQHSSCPLSPLNPFIQHVIVRYLFLSPVQVLFISVRSVVQTIGVPVYKALMLKSVQVCSDKCN